MQATRVTGFILELGTRWGWVVSVTPWLRTTPGSCWIGDWVGLRAGVDIEARGKVLSLYQGLNPGHPVCSQTLVETVQLLATRQLLATQNFHRIAKSAVISNSYFSATWQCYTSTSKHESWCYNQISLRNVMDTLLWTCLTLAAFIVNFLRMKSFWSKCWCHFF
jgi:hypothetical protein